MVCSAIGQAGWQVIRQDEQVDVTVSSPLEEAEQPGFDDIAAIVKHATRT